MRWTEFDPVSGRILQTVEGTSLVQPSPTPTRAILDNVAADGASVYVDPASASLALRPDCSIVLSQAGPIVTLTHVNLGTVVQIAGDVTETLTQDSADGVLEVTFSDPGTYTLSAEQFPEIPLLAQVTVS